MNDSEKRYYQAGARLARTGGPTVTPESYCLANALVDMAKAWVIRGFRDERRENPNGMRGQRLGDPNAYK